jgi:tRNA pseudouridine38-40 synthase
MRYLISVSYNGSKYFGFQRLDKKKTVQGELEKVLTKLNKTVVYVKGAGRTDRGVHARDQKVHFDLSVDIPADRLVNAINSMLDDGIRVNSAEVVDNNFHARFDVKKKQYTYIINLGEYDPIVNDFVYNYNRDINIKLMKKAGKYFKGMHSFEAFTSGERESYNSIIYDVKINRKKDYLYITFVGKSFYRYMVRNMVGALMLVGTGKEDASIIKTLLENKDKKANYMTVPANGLYLEKVEY